MIASDLRYFIQNEYVDVGWCQLLVATISIKAGAGWRVGSQLADLA